MNNVIFRKKTHAQKGVSDDFFSNKRFTGTKPSSVDVLYFFCCCCCGCFAVSIDASKNLSLEVY